MKKKVIACFLTVIMTGAALCGCGSGEGTSAEETVKEAEPAEESVESESMEEEAEEAAEEIMEETAAEEAVDWLAENGLSITPQGDFPFQYSVFGHDERGGDEWLILGKVNTTGNITITENIVDNHKEVEVTVVLDMSDIEDIIPEGAQYGLDYIPIYMPFFIDRYTGSILPYATGLLYGDMSGAMAEYFIGDRELVYSQLQEYGYWKEGTDNENAVIYFTHGTQQDSQYIGTATLLCPSDYDGAVFAMEDWMQDQGEVYYAYYYGGSDGDDEALNTAFRVHEGVHATNPVWSAQGNEPDVLKMLKDDCVFFTAANE